MEPQLHEITFEVEDSYWWFVGRRRITRAVMARWIDGSPRRRILDVGCGTGGNLKLLSGLGGLVSIDTDAFALKLSRRRGSYTLCRASGMMLPFRDGCFDIVTSFGVLYHRDVADDILAITEMARVCRPGGFVVVTGPAFPFLSGSHDVLMHAARRHTVPEIGRKMAGAGLEPLKLSYWNTLLSPVAAIWRLSNRLLRQRTAPQDDMRPLPGFINRMFLLMLTIEAALLPRFSLPFGVSLLCVARKPRAAAQA